MHYPLTATRRIDLVVTELAVIEPMTDGLMLKETAPGIRVQDVLEATDATLIVPEQVPEIVIPA